MAQGKKSFTAYCDWQETFNSLPDDKAGQLIKHLFAYVNDENPQTEDILIKAVFAQIKATLKRDLKKWEAKREQNKENALKRWNKKNANACERIKKVANNAVSVSDSVSDSVRDSVSEKESNIINNNEFLNESLNSSQWIETICMQNNVDIDVIKLYLNHFNDHLITMEEQKVNTKDYKQHFTHWFKKQDLSNFRKKVVGKTNQI